MSTSRPTGSSPALLYLDAGPRGLRSHNRRLGQKFLAAWRAAHPQAAVSLGGAADTAAQALAEADAAMAILASQAA